MSPRDSSARLDDLIEAASYASELSRRGRKAFHEDVLLRLAAQRIVAIAGEAINALYDELKDQAPDYPWVQAISMRNLLTHEYWRTDHGQVWSTTTEDVPEVARRARQVLRDDIEQ